MDVTVLEEGVLVDEKRLLRRGLLLKKDVKKGDVIYTEVPVVAVLQEHLKNKNYCKNCLKDCKEILLVDNTCSKKCSDESKAYVPLESNDPESKATKLNRFLTATNTLTSSLTIRFLLKMLWLEDSNPAVEKYSDWDHLERLYTRTKEASQNEKLESQLLVQIVSKPGFDEFVTPDNYATIKGQMKYNAIAIYDKTSNVAYSLATSEIVRSAKPMTEVKGAGLYFASSYISHSCLPNVSFEFRDGDSMLYVVANQDLQKGTELKVSYVPEGSKKEFIEKEFGFVCKCSKCSSVI